MASRTKSFFDQDHKAKQKPHQWPRRDNTRPPLHEAPVNVPPKPPIPATEKTKAKLQAFRAAREQPNESAALSKRGEDTYEKSEPPQEAPEASKMGGLPVENNPAVEKPSAEPLRSSQAAPVKTPSLGHSKTFPCTPGARLPLEDLIGSFDEHAKKFEPEVRSPEETLGWIPNSSSTLLTPNRKRKRARSSSPSCPTTSSQRQESAFFAGNDTQGEKSTPEADPTADLWQRYGNSKDGREGLKLPDISHLMGQASPRPLKTPAKSAAFRRWASTGNDWPSSKSKRRRMDSRSRISVWQGTRQETESGGKSKVASMVEKIQETLATQKLAQEAAQAGGPPAEKQAPSSSSPLPDTGAETLGKTQGDVSPLNAKQQEPLQRPATTATRPPPPPAALSSFRKPVQGTSGGLSPIGDHARSAPDSVAPAPLHLQSKAPLPAFRRPAMSRTPSGNGRQYPQRQPPPPPPAPPQAVPALQEELEDFGDDFDLSVEDLDELVSQKPLHERSLQEIPPHPNPPCQPQTSFDHQAQQPPQQTPIAIDDDDDDEFGGDDLDEGTLLPPSPRAHSPSKNLKSPKKPHSTAKSSTFAPASRSEGVANRLQRYKIKQVVDGEYTNARGRRCPELLLVGDDERASKTTAITLRDSWAMTGVSPGTIVHVAHLRQTLADSTTSRSSPPGQILITDEPTSPLLIVHPDHMLSATTVADSFDCARKAVLQDRIKATGETNKAMVYGKILHEIFQQALSANQWDAASLAELVQKTVRNHVEGLWELGMSDTVLASEEITAKMGELAAWADLFVADQPSETALVDDKQGEKVWMSISKLIAIEEHIWSPQYGLKGNIDATIQSTLVDHPNEPAKNLIAPFEVKTGRTTQSPAHRAQTALYTLLLTDRYDVTVQAGILYYLESSSMSRIAPPINEIRQMVQQRNRVAAYIFRARFPPKEGQGSDQAQVVPQPTQEIEESGLPALLKNPFKCGKCYARQSCFVYHALVEDGSAESAGMVDDSKKNHSLTWHEAVGHLALSAKDQVDATRYQSWFSKWDRLLTFEESQMSVLRKELWTMSSAEREKAGRCFGNLVLEHDPASTASNRTQTHVDGIDGSGGKINRYTYVFKRAVPKSAASFAEGTQLNVGEPVVVSSEEGQWALANGYVVGATKHNITVAVDRKLGDARRRLTGFDEARNNAFQGTMTVGQERAAIDPDVTHGLYRLDKDEFSNGLALIRNNLVSLMDSHPINTKLRQQIVSSAAPSFNPPSQLPRLPNSQLGEMNEDQQGAVSKVLSAEDYALILGMPGTGKTTTIAHIIRALLAEDKTILLTSFTHTAVDNILMKIRDIAPENSVLRLGVPAKIHPEVQKFCQLAATPRTSIDEIDKCYMGCRIVATTCMGTNHAVFNRRSFDVCIVDEASQITLPTSLGPLLHARKFVLVGDHYQLPPLVQNKSALEGGLDVSLFRQLSEEHPEAVAMLGKQYRMCEDIMSLSNELIYSGKLRCGNDSVAKRTLSISDTAALQDFHQPLPLGQGCRGSCWLTDTVRPERRVVFANIDALGREAIESLTSGKNITNQVEATLTAQLVLSLLKLGVPGKDIGVITLYRSQLALLRQLFKLAGISGEIEIDSADRFQGRDKDCIILSMVRSNESGIVGDLLKDWRRVNVALTRARSKLIVLGSRRTLVNNDLLARFMGLVDRRAWTLDLPKGADTCHTFDFSSQSTASLIPRSTPSPTKKAHASPLKTSEATSPLDNLPQSPSKALRPSTDAGNRGLAKLGSQGKPMKNPGRVISGRVSKHEKQAKATKEQMAFEIWEDLTADDL
ncbi:hypothetical protein D0863_01865 [Hortaea werneckii]|uniref:DNA replication ATP-dependent helicase/nuclease DNA2 n=1 Tax=Hortaea werneckii TaxID=91943 RepID=A0A3M7EJE6_HORWE|nr:hypothetical protein D0863_01865 [Hortaea werneckii]